MTTEMRRDWKRLLVVVALLAAGDRAFRFDLSAGDERSRRAYEWTVFELDPSVVEGVSARSRVVSTPQGLRGDLLGEDSFNILLVGGSTVFCRYLDEEGSLTAQLARALRLQLRESLDLRVATSARAGQLATHSIDNLRRLFADPKTRPRLVIAQLGANDLMNFLDTAPWPPDAGPEGAHASPDGAYVGDQHRALFAASHDPRQQGNFIAQVREAYRSHPKLERLSQPLRAAYGEHLRGFEQRLKQLAALVSTSGARLAIVTQPISYAGSEDARTDRYALFYVDRGEGFVPSPALLARLLGGFNDVSRRVARNQGLPLIDLANELGTCERCFYDQWHFTLVGARRAAERIAPALPLGPESHASPQATSR
jgi:lysophospholipase L1-like esterase